MTKAGDLHDHIVKDRDLGLRSHKGPGGDGGFSIIDSISGIIFFLFADFTSSIPTFNPADTQPSTTMPFVYPAPDSLYGILLFLSLCHALY